MSTLDIILTIFTTLFGGLNILQLLTFRSYKRQRNAEADQAEINSLSNIIKQNQAEIGRLQQRLNDADQRATLLEKRYDVIYERWDKLRDEFETYKLTHK